MTTRIVFRALFAAALVICGAQTGFRLWADDDAAAEFPPAEASRTTEKVGWLRPNNSHPSVGAPYALVDGSGRIRCYVRPTPGMNLGAYSHQKVRVLGQAVTPANASNPVVEVTEIGSPDAVLGRAPASGRRAGADQQPVTQAAYQQPGQQMVEDLPTPAGRQTEADAQSPVAGDGYGRMTPEPIVGGDYNGYDGNDWGQQPGGGNGPPCGCGRPSCSRCCQGFCGPPGVVWVRAEYLFWWTQGMRIPPLVTTGPSTAQPGYLDTPGTTILYGNNQVDNYGRSGGRLTMGTWLNACQTVGIEADYFQLATATSFYSATSTGDPILSRPFFDTRPSLAAQNVEMVASPGSIAGTVTADAYTRFLGAGARLRFNLCCGQQCYSCQCLPGMNGPGGYRFDLLLGYRYLRLGDGVNVNENLTSLNTSLPGSFVLNDNFKTVNQFNGIEFGTALMAYRGRWSLELLYKLALGNTNQLVNINGSTATTQNGATTVSPGGLLALSSNIGQYSRNTLGVVPELGANLGFAVTPRLRVIVGYTFIYWSQVARAGEQIDTDVNSTLLPNNPTSPTGDLRHPAFAFHESPFWAQGISAGLDYRW